MSGSASSSIGITAQALAQAAAMGFGPHADKRIARMARRAAPFSHAQGNRRFEDWVLRIEQGAVVSIVKIPPGEPRVRGTKSLPDKDKPATT